MQHAQKLESLGVLAGGIAHDFNNLLGGILGNADLALQDPAGAEDNLETIVTTAKRAADLCQQLLAYSGRGKIVVQPHDMTSLVGEMGDLLAVPISKKAEIVFDLDEELPTIEGDGTQIRQVVLNLVTNAAESIEYPPGTITVTTGVTDIEDATGISGDVVPGQYVYLDVTDTGCGMDERTRQRMFDPFYSTKFTGRGLGLASVLGIMRGHAGGIQVTSHPGAGTTIRLLFPVSGAPLPVAIAPPEDRGEWHKQGTILVVDDEPAIRRFIVRVLEGAGFEVVSAKDGAEAVLEFRIHNESIVAVVLDLTMPKMDGTQANREMREIREGVPTVVISGFSETEVAENFEASGVTQFLQKPFTSDELLEALHAVLDETPGAESVEARQAVGG
jgi:CheY-like chemotaxis protein